MALGGYVIRIYGGTWGRIGPARVLTGAALVPASCCSASQPAPAAARVPEQALLPQQVRLPARMARVSSEIAGVDVPEPGVGVRDQLRACDGADCRASRGGTRCSRLRAGVRGDGLVPVGELAGAARMRRGVHRATRHHGRRSLPPSRAAASVGRQISTSIGEMPDGLTRTSPYRSGARRAIPSGGSPCRRSSSARDALGLGRSLDRPPDLPVRAHHEDRRPAQDGGAARGDLTWRSTKLDFDRLAESRQRLRMTGHHRSQTAFVMHARSQEPRGSSLAAGCECREATLQPGFE